MHQWKWETKEGKTFCDVAEERNMTENTNEGNDFRHKER